MIYPDIGRGRCCHGAIVGNRARLWRRRCCRIAQSDLAVIAPSNYLTCKDNIWFIRSKGLADDHRDGSGNGDIGAISHYIR